MTVANPTLNIPIFNSKAGYEKRRAEIDSAIQRVLERNYFILGEEDIAFEKAFADFLGVKHAIGVGNGTDAIQLGLLAVGVGAGDEVITTPHTAVFSLLAISQVGAKPVLVDIDPATGLMDVSQIEAKITSATKAIVPVHLYGQSADLAPILALAQKYGLKIVEDSCQAHGTLYQGKATGTWGDIGTYSFYPSKNLGAFGDGGAVVTDDDDLAMTLRMLRNGGQRDRYHHEILGVNSRLDEIQAAILGVKLRYLAEDNNARRERAALYNSLLAPLVEAGHVHLPVEREYGRHIYHLYVIRLTEAARRDDLMAYLKERGIGTFIHYPIPAHLQKAYSWLNQPAGSFPQAEDTAKRIVSLPMYPELELAHVERVAATIAEYFAR